MNEDLKIITIGIDKYFGTFEEIVKDGQLVRHLSVVSAINSNFLKNWIIANNLGTLKNITVSGDMTVQVEELTEEQKLELDQYLSLNALAEAKALNIAKNKAFEWLLNQQS